MSKYVAYYRVSTKRQGQSGLGLEGQQRIINDYLNTQSQAELIAEFTEVESGKNDNREQLNQALKICRHTRATLVVSKLDRLSRDLHFLTSVMKSGLPFVCADNPTANSLTLGILAVIAEEERQRISERTKVALAAAKARGVKLGNPRLAEHRNRSTTSARAAYTEQTKQYYKEMLSLIHSEFPDGFQNMNEVVNRLNELGIRSRRGKPFGISSVWRILKSSTTPD